VVEERRGTSDVGWTRRGARFTTALVSDGLSQRTRACKTNRCNVHGRLFDLSAKCIEAVDTLPVICPDKSGWGHAEQCLRKEATDNNGLLQPI
jgi:hypothetical protein